MSQKVLVVEDDNNIAELLRLYLQKDGFEVSHAADGGKAVEMAKEIQPDLVLLDIMLPVMDGWQVCRELRKTMKMPIIMLTAKGETEDKVSGLEMGADDYIVKPFEVKELLARVHAVLRRTGDDGKPKSKKLTFDKLVINLDSYELIVDGKKIDTPPKEMELLYYFMGSVGQRREEHGLCGICGKQQSTTLAVHYFCPAHSGHCSALLRYKVLCHVVCNLVLVNAQLCTMLAVPVGLRRAVSVPFHRVVIGVDLEQHTESVFSKPWMALV